MSANAAPFLKPQERPVVPVGISEPSDQGRQIWEDQGILGSVSLQAS